MDATNKKPGDFFTFLGQKYASPLRVFSITVIGIYIAEIFAMFFIWLIKPQPYWLQTILDATIMVVIVFPVIYYYSFRELLSHISERKRGEALLSKVLENLPVGVWITDQKGMILHGNTAGQQIWAGERYVGIEQYGEYKGWWLDSGKLIQADEWAAARAVNHGETSVNEEVEIECFDGTHKIILNSSMPILDEHNNLQGAIIVNEDITSRKQYEQQILATNELLERVFYSIDTHIAYLDREFNFLRVNDAYAKAAGHPVDYFIGKNHFALYPHEENQAIFQRVVDTGEPFVVFEKPFEYAEFPERGVTYWDWSLQPVRGPDGAIQGLVMSLVDVTGRKLAEKQLECQNQELLTLSEAERKQRQLAEGILQATLALNESLEMETVLDRIFEVARRILRFTGANIALVTEDNCLYVVRSWGFEDHPQAKNVLYQTFPIDSFPLVQEIIRNQKPLLIEDTAQNPSWMAPPGFEWVRASVIAPLVQAGQVIGIVNMFGENPRVFSQEIAGTILAYAAPAAVSVHNARLFDQEQRARQVAETLRAASLALTQSLDIHVVLERLLEQAQILIPYDVGAVALSGEGDRLNLVALRGSPAQAAPLELLNRDFKSTDYSHIHRVIETRKTYIVPDTQEYPGWTALLGGYVRNWLGVPLFFDESTLGILWMIKTKERFFTQEHALLAEALVSQASVAIQNAWLFEQVRAGHERLQSLSRRLVEVQESERRYIARELHDETSQALTALKFGLHHLEQDCQRPEALLAHVAELKKLADGVVEDLHRLAMDLRPASLDHLGLVTALGQLVKTTGERYRISTHFKTVGISEEKRLPNDLETALYRIVQEALTNTVRHAKARNVDVVLELREGNFLVIIEDDGIGFDTNDIQKGHLGLLGMEERAQMAGGSLQVESRPGGGTTIVAEVPYGNSYLNRR